MNAIKLPVKAYHGFGGVWFVNESNNFRLGQGLTESQAHQIAIALNCHDALAGALEFYARTPRDMKNRLNWSIPATMNDWTNEIRKDAGDIARAALAKVEELRKNQ